MGIISSMAKQRLYVGIDVGGQSIKGGVVDEAGQPLSEIDLTTEAHHGNDHFLGRVDLAIERAVEAAKLNMSQISSIGVATPGTMDIKRGLILEPPNMRPLKNVAVRKHVHNRFRIPTTFQNDANAAAYGEYWVGAGRGADSVVLFTLGTGIGCGIIVHDAIIEGEHSHGAEVGHIIVQMFDGRMCGCGQPGHLEAYASARSIVKRAKGLLASARPSSLRATALAQRNNMEGLTVGEEETLAARHASLIFQAAAAEDELAKEIVEEVAYALAVGAVNMMHTINPDRIIFGGGMTAAGTPFLARIQHHVQRLAFPVPAQQTQIMYAELGTKAGFIGSAGCARRDYLRRAKG